jgi:hypothetical protein
MITDGKELDDTGGMLIDWDLCKVINPQGEQCLAHQYTCTVSPAHMTCSKLLTYHARGLGSSWQLILFNTLMLHIPSYTTSNWPSGSSSGLHSCACQICGAPKIAQAFSMKQ